MKYTFTFTEAETNYILNALAAKPFAEVAGLIGNMNKQIVDQQKPAETGTPEENPQA